jgi:outer membrane lipoprotein-sorting protein
MKTLISCLLLLNLITASISMAASPPRLSNLNDPSFVAVKNQLSRSSLVTGKFQQTRTLTLLSKPLISSGTFSLSKNNGLHWEQLTPFVSKLFVTKKIIQQQMGSHPTTTLTQAQEPIIFSFSNIFLAVFHGDINHVQQYFHIYFSGNTKEWKLALKPYSSPLNKAINSIELKGAKTIQSITIEDAHKNTMRIKLFDIKQA